jgi:hypothetical protein
LQGELYPEGDGGKPIVLSWTLRSEAADARHCHAMLSPLLPMSSFRDASIEKT